MKGIRVWTLFTVSIGVSSAYPSSSTRSFQPARHSVISVIPPRRFPLSAVVKESDELFGNLFFGKRKTKTPVERFFHAWNELDMDTAIAQFAQDCVYEDATFYSPFEGRSQLQRQLLLRRDATSVQYVIDDLVAVCESKVGVKYHLELNGTVVPDSRHVAFYTMNASTGLIQTCYDVVEPSRKTGQLSLSILTAASKIIGTGDHKDMGNVTISSSDEVVSKRDMEETGWLSSFLKGDSSMRSTETLMLTPPERFFSAWNQRDMSTAIDVFTEDCCYEDTVFPKPFSGRDQVKNHFLACADVLSPTFQFIVDDIIDGGDTIMARWHVENEGKQMPFTRGCSVYKVEGDLIREVLDEIEPAVLKLGGLDLFVTSMRTKLAEEPIRFIPLVMWVTYMYIVFFSEGILPGANALQLEQRTWEEVRDLSLNFFLVAPILNLPFSPAVHPILEGIFNLLLSWAALFAGFFSDERDDKPNLFPIVPTVVGMQFLTSAFLLPYLATRTSEKDFGLYREDISIPARIVESRLLGLFLGFVGGGSIAWGALARQADFGGWSERVASFWQLMSFDRVGSSFLVDLAIFAIFQGWLVDDDMKRRGGDFADRSRAEILVRRVGKYIPFFGLAFYMTFRPTFPSGKDE